MVIRTVTSVRFLIAACILLTFSLPTFADERCAQWAAQLESAEGRVEWQSPENTQWQTASSGFQFCYGDRVRVVQERAVLRLANDTLVRLQENSLVNLLPEEKGFWFELLEGAGHFLSRTPKQFTIKAPYLNAAVDGTEFVVNAYPQENRVAVMEGDVRVSNDLGEVRLSEGTQTTATATTAPNPVQSIRLRDAAEWILYYPPLVVQVNAPAPIENLIQQENYGAALTQLTANDLTPETTVLAASLAFNTGNVAEGEQLLSRALNTSPAQAEAQALQALRTLIGGDNEGALAQTTQLIKTHPQNPSALLAHAYAQQSHGKIEEALQTNLQAQALIPDNLFVLARTAELQLSVGNTRAAQKLINQALKQAPNHSRLNTLAGFIALNRFATGKAQNHFQTAIQTNSNEPLARLGLALALIQKGKIEAGRAQMEMAVMLDPGSSLLRSYLGKTYASQNQNDWADTQYQLAKNLDPNDPTPWLYEAHLKHEENKPGEALRLISTAIEKNDNRAVYRSRMLLDSDVAARSANQAQIYRSLGIDEMAHKAASQSVVDNPLDFAGHRALAVYTATERSTQNQVSRLNETLLAKILMPIGATEFDVGANTLSLLNPNWTNPSKSGPLEYTNLFSKTGLRGDFSSYLGSNSLEGYEWQLSEIQNKFMLTGGEYSLGSDGFRANNDFSTRISEANLHFQITENSKLFAQLNQKKDSTGELFYNVDYSYEPFGIGFDESVRVEIEEKTYQIGSYVALPGNNTMLFSFDSGNISSQDTYTPQADQKMENYHFTIIGKSQPGSYQVGLHKESITTKFPQPDNVNPIEMDNSEALRAYGHIYFELNPKLEFLLGINFSKLQWQYRFSEKTEEFDNYRTGLKWSASDNISYTIAYWTDSHTRHPRFGSLENSQIFDIPVGDYFNTFQTSFTESANSAASFHGDFNPIFVSLSIANRSIEPWTHIYVRSDPTRSNIRNYRYEEDTASISLSYLLTPTTSIRYHGSISQQENNTDRGKPVNVPVMLERISNKIEILTNQTRRLSYELNVENINQNVDYIRYEYSDAHAYPADGNLINVNATYKFLPSNLVIDVSVLNLTDQRISIFSRRLFEGPTPLSLVSPTHITIPPSRLLLVKLNYSF